MKTFFLVLGLLLVTYSHGQTMHSRLALAVKNMEKDEQFKHAIISLYVVDSKTGKVVFDKNSQIGLAPASCLKVVTSVSAFEMLGKGYKYKTELLAYGEIKDSVLNGYLELKGYGDPTSGSWRYGNTAPSALTGRWVNALLQKKIRTVTGEVLTNGLAFSFQSIPGGWVWEDVGNYYGAGAGALNWRENQFDLFLKAADNSGGSVSILGTVPANYGGPFLNELKTGKKGSGDNAYVYLPAGNSWLVKGTIPAGEKNFKISGAIQDPETLLGEEFRKALDSAGISYKKKPESKKEVSFISQKNQVTLIDEYFSPMLDSINYWFLQKSVNLYGEAFVKTIAYEKTGFGDTDTGVNIIKDFWSKNGIESSTLNIKDGSGLSPANRVTTNALVTVMQYAKKQDWFSSFYNALPEMNGIKMKSGYIGGVRSYTGYIKSKTGTEYSFSFIINNFDGNPGTVREKMWKLLDILK